MNPLEEFGEHYFGTPHGRDKPGKNLNPKGTLVVHFSGWAVTRDMSQTVAQIESYYVHGNPSEFNDGLRPDELHKGYPVSGDYSKRFQHWKDTGYWPTYGDIPGNSQEFGIKPVGAIF